MFYIESVLKVLGIVVPLLVGIALFTVAERKVLSSIQRRRGPNIIGAFGLLQAFADGLKLLLKETVLPSSSNKALFVIAPMITFFLSLIGWAVIPVNETYVFADLNVGVLYIFAISSLGVYGIIISGWASNSKYAFLGALRSAAQIVSYEISIGFIIINVILCANSLNLTQIVLAQEAIWYCVPLLPIFILFFVSCLAETNRHPFDLPEAEAELVSGYNVEYSAMGFALFFLGEYGNIILISSLNVILFIGGWLFPLQIFEGCFCFAIKTFFFISLFIWVRAAYPRYRYDQLIRLGWKVFLPLSISWTILTASILLSFNWYISLHVFGYLLFYFC
uniref:NADH-ubiquinone oxidoreductase chain 1 n=1 Tax=Aurantiochytrium acetophilum TaxID=2172886 RepID=A0A481XK94_9STRA|nr:NADH dehydrogenase subunit 1 [Aurantiochytrium acetophilum]